MGLAEREGERREEQSGGEERERESEIGTVGCVYRGPDQCAKLRLNDMLQQ